MFPPTPVTDLDICEYRYVATRWYRAPEIMLTCVGSDGDFPSLTAHD